MTDFAQQIDARTLAIYMSLLYLAMVLVMLHTLRTRKTYPGFGAWTVGITAWATGVILNFLFSAAPVLILSNALTLFGLPLIYHGFALYCRLDQLWPRSLANLALAGAGLAAMVYFRLAEDNYPARAVVFSLVQAIVFARTALEPLLCRQVPRYPMQRTIAVTFLIYAAMLVIRAWDNLFLHQYSGIADDPTLKIIIMLGGAASTILVFSMLTMTTSRVEAELVEAQARMKSLADTDVLTGLCSRRYFMEQAGHILRAATRYGHQVSLLLLDIDHFKQVNDTRGHAAGDAVLAAVAGRIKRAVREVDVAGRLGGEEFGVLLPETGRVQAELAAERIRAGIEELKPEGLLVTASIGVAELGLDGLDALMARADACLYAAKQAGRNRVSGGDTPA